jgi:hypothetical protein
MAAQNRSNGLMNQDGQSDMARLTALVAILC